MKLPGPAGLSILMLTPAGPLKEILIPELLIVPEMGSVPLESTSTMLVPFMVAINVVKFPNLYWLIKAVGVTSGKLVCIAAGDNN